MFFSKKLKKHFTNFLWAENVLKFFQKKISKKKHFFSQKRKMFFNLKKKTKVFVYRGNKIFFLQKKSFCQKLSVR